MRGITLSLMNSAFKHKSSHELFWLIRTNNTARVKQLALGEIEERLASFENAGQPQESQKATEAGFACQCNHAFDRALPHERACQFGLLERIEKLEKVSHAPFDFEELVNRITSLEEDAKSVREIFANHVHTQRERKPITSVPLPAIPERQHPNAENRAWAVIGEWIENHIRNRGTYAMVLIDVPRADEQWQVTLMNGIDDKAMATKAGTSRVRALAALASWCEMNPTAMSPWSARPRPGK